MKIWGVPFLSRFQTSFSPFTLDSQAHMLDLSLQTFVNKIELRTHNFRTSKTFHLDLDGALTFHFERCIY